MRAPLRTMALTAMLSVAPLAFAGDMPAGQFGGYLTMTDADFDDGTGFGIKGWASVNGPWFVHGEYQTVGFKTPGGADVDLNELRFGGGLVGDLQQGVQWLAKAEYIDFGSDFDQSGFGVHGGVLFEAGPALGLFGTIGFLTTDDTDGLELNFGGQYRFSREWSGFVDYRAYSGDVDGGGSFDLTDIRFGAMYNFY